MRLIESDRFDADTGSAKKNVTLTACVRPNLTFKDDGEFNESLPRSLSSGRRHK